MPHHEVERYYGLVDVLAYPRKRMRLTDLVTPLKPLEAMAQGRLVARQPSIGFLTGLAIGSAIAVAMWWRNARL